MWQSWQVAMLSPGRRSGVTGRKRPNPAAAILCISRQHELGESALDVEIVGCRQFFVGSTVVPSPGGVPA